MKFGGPSKRRPLPGPAPAGRSTHLNGVDRHVRLHLQQYINYLCNIICVEGWQENEYNTIQYYKTSLICFELMTSIYFQYNKYKVLNIVTGMCEYGVSKQTHIEAVR